MNATGATRLSAKQPCIGRLSDLVAVLVLSIVASGCGCAQKGIDCYAARGTSANPRALDSLSDQMIRLYAYRPDAGGAEAAESADEVRAALDDVVGRTIGARFGNPSFRSLCAICNRYFASWDRLVIVERLGFVNGEYGFFILGQSGERLAAVTNIAPASLKEGQQLIVLPQNRSSLEATLTELEEAGAALPDRLLWFENVDWPLYIVHDIKADGSSFSFGLCGEIEGTKSDTDLDGPEISYLQAGQLLKELRGTGIVALDDPRGKKMALAGRTYSRLLAKIWEHVLGRLDPTILGDGNTQSR